MTEVCYYLLQQLNEILSSSLTDEDESSVLAELEALTAGEQSHDAIPNLPEVPEAEPDTTMQTEQSRYFNNNSVDHWIASRRRKACCLATPMVLIRKALCFVHLTHGLFRPRVLSGVSEHAIGGCLPE